MNVTSPAIDAQLFSEALSLARKPNLRKEDSARGELLVRLLESRSAREDQLRELKTRIVGSEYPARPSEFRFFLAGKTGKHYDRSGNTVLREAYEKRDMGV